VRIAGRLALPCQAAACAGERDILCCGGTQLHAIAPEFYSGLAFHTSWAWVTWTFLTVPEVGPWTRVRRRQRGGDAQPAPVPASAPAAVLAGERASVAAQQTAVAAAAAVAAPVQAAAAAVAAPVQAAAAALAPAEQVRGCRLPPSDCSEAAPVVQCNGVGVAWRFAKLSQNATRMRA
jgi:hypothetical protein